MLALLSSFQSSRSWLVSVTQPYLVADVEVEEGRGQVGAAHGGQLDAAGAGCHAALRPAHECDDGAPLDGAALQDGRRQVLLPAARVGLELSAVLQIAQRSISTWRSLRRVSGRGAKYRPAAFSCGRLRSGKASHRG